MIIHVNDEPVTLPQAMSLSLALVHLFLIKSDRVANPDEKEHDRRLASLALVLNGEVVPRNRWSSINCRQDDRLELFSVVAGG
jgi:thiamine biosynthesis protein ThiS